MKKVDVVNEVLIEGLTDWVYSPSLVRVVKDVTGLEGERLLRVTMDTIRELLETGLMVVGEMGDASRRFAPWVLTIPEALGRIETEWRALGVDNNFVAICWFSNTPAGDERARTAQSRRRS